MYMYHNTKKKINSVQIFYH